MIQKFSRNAKRSPILGNDKEEEVEDMDDKFHELGQEGNFTEEELISEGVGSTAIEDDVSLEFFCYSSFYSHHF